MISPTETDSSFRSSCHIYKHAEAPTALPSRPETLGLTGFEAFVSLYLRQSDDDVVKGKRRTDVGVHHE